MTAASVAAPAKDRVAAGILLVLGAVLLLSMMDVVVKWMSTGYTTVELVFWRGLFGLLPIIAFIAVSGGLTVLRTKKPLVHLGRGLLNLGALFCFFYAFSVMPLADAYAIASSAPLFITALSVPFLGERVGVHRWSAVVIGFFGVLIVFRPWEGTEDGGLHILGATATLLGALFFAFMAISNRWLGRNDTSQAIMLYSNLVVVGTSGVAMAILAPGLPPLADLGLFFCAGLLGGAGVICMTHAFRIAPPSALSPFDYTGIVWGIFFGLLLFDDWPDPYMLIGSVVIMTSGLYILYREARAVRARPEVE